MHHIYLRVTRSVISNHIAYQTRAHISLAGRIIFAFIQPRSFLVGVRTQSSSRSLIPLFTVAKKRAVARYDAVPARGHPIRKPAILNESKFSKPTNEANRWQPMYSKNAYRRPTVSARYRVARSVNRPTDITRATHALAPQEKPRKFMLS